MYEVEDVPLFSQFIEFLSWLEVWLCPCSFCLYWDDQMVLAMKLLCCLDCFALPVAQQPLKSQPHPDLAWKGCQPSVLGWTSSHMLQRPAISSPHLFASSVNCYKFQKHSSFHTLGDFFFFPWSIQIIPVLSDFLTHVQLSWFLTHLLNGLFFSIPNFVFIPLTSLKLKGT